MRYDLKWLCEMFNINHFVQHNAINRKVTKSDPHRKYYVTNSYRQHEHNCTHQISKRYCRTADANGPDSFWGTSKGVSSFALENVRQNQSSRNSHILTSRLLYEQSSKSPREMLQMQLCSIFHPTPSRSESLVHEYEWSVLFVFRLFQDLKLCVCPICLTCYRSEFLHLWNQSWRWSLFLWVRAFSSLMFAVRHLVSVFRMCLFYSNTRAVTCVYVLGFTSRSSVFTCVDYFPFPVLSTLCPLVWFTHPSLCFAFFLSVLLQL